MDISLIVLIIVTIGLLYYVLYFKNKGTKKVTSVQIADLLYSYIDDKTAKILDDRLIKDLQDLKIEIPDLNKLKSEMFYLNMFAISYTLMPVNSSGKIVKVLFRVIVEKLQKDKFSQDNINQIIYTLGERFETYSKAMSNQEGTGPLWYLSKEISKNIFGEIVENAFVCTRFATEFTFYITEYAKVINKYKITDLV